MSNRGVSSPVGVILLLGITAMAVVALLLVGGTALSDTRADAERSQTENAMAQFSSKASLVGLGESGHQQFAMGRLSTGELAVDPNAGNVTLLINRTGQSEPEEIENASLGAIVYRSGDTEIAYQGGGVWEYRGGSSSMISPPEYHYRLETLTFPIITVSGNGHANGDVRGTVRRGSEPLPWYPVHGDDDRSNPLEDGTVLVRIESRYCSGWETFFRQRSQGVLEETCDENDTIEVDLTVPFQIESDKPLKAKAIDPGTGNTDIPDEWEEDVIAPSVSSSVESRIQQCADDGCDSIPENEEDEITEGTYNESDGYTLGERTFNTTDGDITVIIDGDLNLDGDLDIDFDGDPEESGSVTFYVRGNVDAQPREYNTGGLADKLAILVHSDAESVVLRGNTQYTGIIYAPGSRVDVNGNAHVKGVVIGELVDISGQPPDFESADELDEYQIVTGESSLTYLHVSENPITVELD